MTCTTKLIPGGNHATAAVYHHPRSLSRQRQPRAIDLTPIPYHGQPLHDVNEVDRGQAKSGASHFHAYATAYVIRKGRRFTVALTAVGRGDPLPGVLRRLVRQAA